MSEVSLKELRIEIEEAHLREKLAGAGG